MAPFVHLHCHSEYSLTDGSIRIDELIAKVKSLGHSAVALTDHANLFGAIDFYTIAKAQQIKAILGAELYVEPSKALREFIEINDPQQKNHGCFQMVALAKNNHGYHELVKLVSSGYTRSENSNKVPIVPCEALRTLSSDVVFVSSYHGGFFSYLVKLLVAKKISEEYCSQLVNGAIQDLEAVHTRGDFYAEICSNHLPSDSYLIDAVGHAATEMKIPLVASANAHYLNPEDSESHLVLVAIKNDLKIPQLRQRRKNVRAHVLNNDEMKFGFQKWPEALANTIKIADACNVSFEFGKYYLPKIATVEHETTEEALARLARNGLEQRFILLRQRYGTSFDEKRQNEYRARLEYEIKVICDMGFADYFLIVQDFINWAKEQDIPVGPGRGSGAGSLVAYSLRITDLDPIPYQLIFERFLNPERVSMPDFDVDFCQDRRDEVIKYVIQRYGKDQVAQITTFGKMQARAVIRDVGRALDMSYGKVDRIAKFIPEEIGIKLSDAIAREPRLNEEASRDATVRDLLTIAQKLEGLSRHTSVHAAGIVISDGPMENYVPVYRGEDGGLITQFEMKTSEKVGLVKFDFLGLKTLTVIQKAIQLIEKTRSKKLDIAMIPMDDAKVFQLISEGKSVGIFQLESRGMQNLLLKLRPSTFEDIIALVALFRPGPLGSGMVDDFVERKHGRQKIEYLHPLLEPILKDTYGTILYQEQVQKIAAVLAHYTLGEADLLRRAMGKKKPEEMAKQKSRFVKGCLDNGIEEKISSNLFDLMAKFAEYGFNKSHSAAYGLVSYQTAYLKTQFAAEFFAASMTCDMDSTDKIIRYAKDCRQMGLKLLGPDLNQSLLDFSVPAPMTVRFGLAAIKGIGRASIEPLLEEREARGPFIDLNDLARRSHLGRVGKKTLELLIDAGALDFFGYERQYLFRFVADLVAFSIDHHEAKARGQKTLFNDDDLETGKADRFEIPSESLNQENKIQSFAAAPHEPLSALHREKALLGVYVSQHPVELFKHEYADFCNASITDLPKLAGQNEVYVPALFVDSFERTTKDERQMLVLRLEDQNSEVLPAFMAGEAPCALPSSQTLVICKFRVMRGFEDGPPRPKLEYLWTLENFRQQRAKQIDVALNFFAGSKVDPEAVLDRLNMLIKKFPGSVPVKMSLSYATRARVHLQTPHLKINPSNDMVLQLQKLVAQCDPRVMRIRFDASVGAKTQ